MEILLYEIFTKQIVNSKRINFRGDAIYYKGSTANQTINYRKLLNEKIRNNGLNIEIQKEILKWGGIHGFKQHTDVSDTIRQLESKKSINSKTANAISSYSKLFAFYSPTNYFILDARVAYVINKIIINNNSINYTPIKFNINRSRNASLIENYRLLMSNWKGDTLKVEEFYAKYCNIIKNIHNYFIDKDPLIFKNMGFVNDDPEIIEMLLFYLADYL